MNVATAAVPSTTDETGIVREFFKAIANHDLATVTALLHPEATWNHRNRDRFAGLHQGVAGIQAFIGDAMALTQGTLQPVPQSFMSDGQGQVVVLVRLLGTRPDGRSSDDLQVLLCRVEGTRVRSIEHFVGDPDAVAAFWA